MSIGVVLFPPNITSASNHPYDRKADLREEKNPNPPPSIMLCQCFLEYSHSQSERARFFFFFFHDKSPLSLALGHIFVNIPYPSGVARV